jgi:hypothetical protein
MLVVDDALLFAVLAGIAEQYLQLAVDQGELFTTGSWYWRLRFVPARLIVVTTGSPNLGPRTKAQAVRP